MSHLNLQHPDFNPNPVCDSQEYTPFMEKTLSRLESLDRLDIDEDGLKEDKWEGIADKIHLSVDAGSPDTLAIAPAADKYE